MTKTTVVFLTEHTATAHINQTSQRSIGSSGLLDGADSGGDIGGQQQNIVAGKERLEFALPLLIILSNALHIKAISDNKTIKTQLLVEQIGHNWIRKSGRTMRTRIERVDLEMSNHHSPHPGIDQTAERIEIHTVDLKLRVVDDRKAEVTVRLGIAVAREMFCNSQHALTLQTIHKLERLGSHPIGIFSKGTDTYDGIERIRVEVDNRGEIDIDAKLAALGSDFLSHLENKMVILLRHSAEEHLMRKRITIREPHTETIFRIDTDP